MLIARHHHDGGAKSWVVDHDVMIMIYKQSNKVSVLKVGNHSVHPRTYRPWYDSLKLDEICIRYKVFSSLSTLLNILPTLLHIPDIINNNNDIIAHSEAPQGRTSVADYTIC